MKKHNQRIFLTCGNGFICRNILEYLGKRYDFVSPSIKELDLKIENLASSTPLKSSGVFASIKEWVGEKITVVTGYFKNILTDKITTKEFCLEDVCVTKEEFKKLLDHADIQNIQSNNNNNADNNNDDQDEEENQQNVEENMSTTTPETNTEEETATTTEEVIENRAEDDEVKEESVLEAIEEVVKEEIQESVESEIEQKTVVEESTEETVLEEIIP